MYFSNGISFGKTRSDLKTPQGRTFTMLIFFFLVVLLLPQSGVSAAVEVSEIMYAPEEGVAHEWFEIFNGGDAQINLKDWRFNDGSNHVFEEPPKNGGQGSLIISPGVYVIVAKEADTFLSLHPGFSGTVIDGSFSLTDTGDTLSLIDQDGVVVDTASYGENAGAQKNGSSLQKINNVWEGKTPTPGEANTSGSNTNTNTTTAEERESNTASSTPTPATTTTGSSFPVEPQIFASAGPSKRTAVTGGDIIFSGSAWGLKKEPIENARMVWNFGDGATKEGKSVAHTYQYPGIYVVVLDASSGYFSATSRVTVEVTPADIMISSIGDSSSFFIELYNHASLELDLSGWSLRTPTQTFILPVNTIIAPGKKIKFSPGATSFSFSASVSLHYPNGNTAAVYKPTPTSSDSSVPPPKTIAQKQTSSQNTMAVKQNANTSSGEQPVTLANKNDEKNPDAEGGTSMPQYQGASLAALEEKVSLSWWLVGVFVLALLGVAGLFTINGKGKLELIEEEANAYEIIEEKDETDKDKIPF